jgi:TonB family protein
VIQRALAAVLLSSLACGGSEKPTPTAPEPSTSSDDDEEPDDGLELTSTRGRMDPADVEAGLAPHAAALEDCYKSRVGKQRWMGGKVELKWEIAADGALRSAQIASSDLGAWPVEKCLLEVARAIQFKPPRGGDADFTVPLEFSARGQSQWWDEDRSAQVLAPRAVDLAECVATGEAPPEGVVITVYVGTRGKVQSVGFASAGAPLADGWADCAAEMIRTWQLVDPRGQVAKLTYRLGDVAAASNE